MRVAEHKKPKLDELEWRAEWWHDLWMKNQAARGFHHPSKHINAFEVPPPLRDDGKTRCALCSLNMVSYSQLPENVKESDRDIVRNIAKCDQAWEAVRGG